MTKHDDNKKTASTEVQKIDETQKLSVSDKSSDSMVTIEALKKRIEELDNKYKRALADYQNLEKRIREERNDWILRANKDLLLHLLPVLDTLILAKKHIKTQDEGLDLSIRQFQDLLKKEAVEKIEAVGKEFDPKLMQCVDTMEGTEGKVLEEIQTGYRYKDNTLLRVSLVTVGKKEVEKEKNN